MLKLTKGTQFENRMSRNIFPHASTFTVKPQYRELSLYTTMAASASPSVLSYLAEQKKNSNTDLASDWTEIEELYTEK